MNMIIAFGFLDRALDIVGLIAIVYWTVKGTRWISGVTKRG